MKKIGILILMMFVITGCTVKYDIKIDNDEIKEIAEFVQDNSVDWNEKLDTFWGYSVNEFMEQNYKTYTGALNGDSENYYTMEKEEGVEYYKKERILTSNKNGIKFLYNFTKENYGLSKIATYCYQNINYSSKDKKISIKTTDQFECFNYYEMLDEVVVNVTTSWNYKVISHNADKVDGEKYTWIINRDNALNKPIEIELKRVINWRLILIIAVPSIIIVTIVFFILKGKILKNNQI